MTKPEESGFLQRNAHVQIRRHSDNPQTPADAEFIEESMHGLYSDQLARLGVAYYYNQFYAKSADIDFLKSIDFNTFAKGAVVEFHGCRTAEVVPILNTWVKDNFAQDFSSRLGDKGIVIGHITNSSPDKNPNRNVNDYRYGKVRVYNNGTLTQDGVERWGLKLEHSSTP